MPSFINYKHNVRVLSPDPTGDASLELNNDLKAIADFLDGVSLIGHTHSGSDITSGTVSDSRLSSNVQNAIAATHSPATIGTANGLTLSGQALSLAAATTSTAGAMSATDKTKLNGVASGATANSSDATLLSRANHTGTQSAATITGLTKSSVGLANVDNTSDANKPISNAVTTALSSKLSLTAQANLDMNTWGISNVDTLGVGTVNANVVVTTGNVYTAAISSTDFNALFSFEENVLQDNNLAICRWEDDASDFRFYTGQVSVVNGDDSVRMILNPSGISSVQVVDGTPIGLASMDISGVGSITGYFNGPVNFPNGFQSAGENVALASNLNNYLPLSGGTMSGTLEMNGHNINGVYELSVGSGGIIFDSGTLYYNGVGLQIDGVSLDMGGGNINSVGNLTISGGGVIGGTLTLGDGSNAVNINTLGGTLNMGGGDIASVGVITSGAFNTGGNVNAGNVYINAGVCAFNGGRIIEYTGTKYANNAAAITGGLAVGTVYATATGEMRVVV